MTRCLTKTTTGCHSAEAFDELRRRPALNASFERALAFHLSAPCLTCLRRLHSLAPLLGESLRTSDSGRTGEGRRIELPHTDSALLHALRALGGWPPARWLQVDRKRACEGVGQPLGFLRLVLEEARFTHRLEVGVELPRWVEIILQVDESSRAGCPSGPLLARALCYLTLAELGKRRPHTAFDLFGRAARLIDRFPRDRHLAALGFEPYGVLVAGRRSDFVEGQFDLAADAVGALDRRRWAEIRLTQARTLLSQGFFDDAIDVADQAVGGLGERFVPLVLRSAQQIHALAARQAMTESSPGIHRFLRAAEFTVSMVPIAPINPAFDAALSHETAGLLRWLEDTADQHRPFWLRQVEPLAFDSHFEEASFVAVLAALDHEHEPEHRRRLARLTSVPGVLQQLVALRPEAEATLERTAGVRGVPESVGRLVELLRRLEADA